MSATKRLWWVQTKQSGHAQPITSQMNPYQLKTEYRKEGVVISDDTFVWASLYTNDWQQIKNIPDLHTFLQRPIEDTNTEIELNDIELMYSVKVFSNGSNLNGIFVVHLNPPFDSKWNSFVNNNNDHMIPLQILQVNGVNVSNIKYHAAMDIYSKYAQISDLIPIRLKLRQLETAELNDFKYQSPWVYHAESAISYQLIALCFLFEHFEMIHVENLKLAFIYYSNCFFIGLVFQYLLEKATNSPLPWGTFVAGCESRWESTMIIIYIVYRLYGGWFTVNKQITSIEIYSLFVLSLSVPVFIYHFCTKSKWDNIWWGRELLSKTILYSVIWISSILWYFLAYDDTQSGDENKADL